MTPSDDATQEIEAVALALEELLGRQDLGPVPSIMVGRGRRQIAAQAIKAIKKFRESSIRGKDERDGLTKQLREAADWCAGQHTDADYVALFRDAAAQLSTLHAQVEAMRAVVDAAAPLLIEFVNAREEGHIDSFPTSARTAVRRMEEALARALRTQDGGR